MEVLVDYTRALVIFTLFFVGGIPSTLAQLNMAEAYYQKIEKNTKHTPQAIRFIQADMGLVDDYSTLCQIILIRHGEPALNKTGWRKRNDAIRYTFDYDSVGIYPASFIPVLLEQDEVKEIYTSDINRSIATAVQVFQRREIQSPNALFNEFERKVFSFPNIKLPLSWWLVGSRTLWFVGLNKKNIESFSAAKTRAKRAALFLESDALQNKKTLLVSHGLLNHYIVKYLKKNGWTEIYDGGKGYLSQKLLVKYKTSTLH